jgi:DNA mismatch endonuclease (patch repair protein)
MGLRFTTRNRDLPGSPDLANRSRRIAVFVHGCFWHRHVNCKHTTTPKTNPEFWLAKFARNVARDQESVKALRARGFSVAIIWGCESNQPTKVRRKLAKFQIGSPDV